MRSWNVEVTAADITAAKAAKRCRMYRDRYDCPVAQAVRRCTGDSTAYVPSPTTIVVYGQVIDTPLDVEAWICHYDGMTNWLADDYLSPLPKFEVRVAL